jgi:hypothetical protein
MRLAKNGHHLIPLVDLVNQARLAIDGLIDIVGKRNTSNAFRNEQRERSGFEGSAAKSGRTRLNPPEAKAYSSWNGAGDHQRD